MFLSFFFSIKFSMYTEAVVLFIQSSISNTTEPVAFGFWVTTYSIETTAFTKPSNSDQPHSSLIYVFIC